MHGAGFRPLRELYYCKATLAARGSPGPEPVPIPFFSWAASRSHVEESGGCGVIVEESGGRSYPLFVGSHAHGLFARS